MQWVRDAFKRLNLMRRGNGRIPLDMIRTACDLSASKAMSASKWYACRVLSCFWLYVEPRTLDYGTVILGTGVALVSGKYIVILTSFVSILFA